MLIFSLPLEEQHKRNNVEAAMFYQRSFRLFQSDFSKDIHQRSRLLCFTQNDSLVMLDSKYAPF